MSDIILNIIFILVALGFAIYSFNRDKKKNAMGFIAVMILLCIYTYRLWIGV